MSERVYRDVAERFLATVKSIGASEEALACARKVAAEAVERPAPEKAPAPDLVGELVEKFAADVAEVADETLSSEGDPKVYEREMATLRERVASLARALLARAKALVPPTEEKQR